MNAISGDFFGPTKMDELFSGVLVQSIDKSQTIFTSSLFINQCLI